MAIISNFSTSHVSNYQLTFPFLPFLETNSEKEKGDSVLLFCKSVNLPHVSMEVVPVVSPFITHKEPGKTLDYENLTVTFAVDELFNNYKFIYNWILSSKHPERFGLVNRGVDATLHILSNKKNAKIGVIFKGLFPIDLSEIPFAYTSTDSDDLLVTATFTYNYFILE